MLLTEDDGKFLGTVCHYRRTCLPHGAEAEKRCDSVDARGARAARRRGAVIDVHGAVVAAPAVNAHAGVAADRVAAGPAVLASVRLQATLVHVFSTVLACGEAGR